MADPISLGGTAVGVVSLGLTVCQGLHWYYNACRDGPSDVNTLVASLDRLIRALEMLGAVMKDSVFDVSTRSQIESYIADCDDAIRNLDCELEKVKREVPASSQGARLSLKSKMSNAGKTLLYPFRESTLKKLRGFIEEICENLALATSSVQLKTSAETLRKFDDVLAPLADLSVTAAEIKKGVETLVAAERSGLVADIKKGVDTLVTADGAGLVAEIKQGVDTIIDNERRTEILRWLSAADPTSNHEAARKLWQEDTGLWLTHRSAYIAWRDGASPLLWLYGIPGCGKTILCSTIIDDVRGHLPNGAAVAYFYFDFRDTAKQSYTHALRSLLQQLCLQSTDAFHILEALHQRQGPDHRAPTSAEMVEALRKVSVSLPHTYIILDALDECPERSELLDFLNEMGKWKLDQLHIMVTSREVTDISDALGSLGARPVALESRLVGPDIESYIRTRLRVDKALKWPQNVQDEIEDSLTKGARGMFRWVYCQLDALCKCRTAHQVRESLRSLPRSLEETYDRILVGISDIDRAYTFRALQWLAFSACPVSVEEVAEAMIVELDSELPHVDRDRALRDPHDLLDICTSLVRVSHHHDGQSASPPKKVLELAHFSVKEYLESLRIVDGPAASFHLESVLAHRALAECCLAYLLTFERPMSREELSAYPLSLYSAKYWPLHMRQAGEDCNTLIALGSRLVSPELSCFENSLRLHNEDNPTKGPRGTPLYYMTRYGVLSLARSLVVGGAVVNAEGGEYGSALQAAVAEGHLDVVQLLLANGADAERQRDFIGSPLQVAALQCNLELVRLLLGYGANVNAQGGIYGSALLAAMAGGNLDIAALLLDRGADATAPIEFPWPEEDIEAALTASLFAGFGIDRETPRRDDFEHIMASAAYDCLELAQLALFHGADANTRGGVHGTVLQTAAARGGLEVTRLLLDCGADVNAKGGYYGSALMAAAACGNLEVAQLLLDYGADVGAEGGKYGSAFQAAMARGHTQVARLLLRASLQPPQSSNSTRRSRSLDSARHVRLVDWQRRPSV